MSRRGSAESATLTTVLRRGVSSLLLLVAVGCSADSVDLAEPELDTKGAFFAVSADAGDFELYRTLAVLGNGDDDDVFFVFPYLSRPTSLAEARELAKDPALAHGNVKAIGRRYFMSRTWKVVWFRSVSPEEEAEFR